MEKECAVHPATVGDLRKKERNKQTRGGGGEEKKLKSGVLLRLLMKALRI